MSQLSHSCDGTHSLAKYATVRVKLVSAMCSCERFSETYTAIARYREPQREIVVNHEP